MARTPTTQIPLGFTAPNFNLPDTISGNDVSLKDIQGTKGTVVMFMCNHCPFVIHVIEEIVNVANDYQSKGFGFVAISSNDVENYPEDAPNKMKLFAEQYRFSFPYLYDETQEIAKAYDAACTPDFSVFDKELSCVYRGQLDDARPENGAPNDGADLRGVLDALFEGKEIAADQKPSLGCNIKWKP